MHSSGCHNTMVKATLLALKIFGRNISAFYCKTCFWSVFHLSGTTDVLTCHPHVTRRSVSCVLRSWQDVTHSVFIPADFHLVPQHHFAYNSGFLGKRKPLWFMRSGAARTDRRDVKYEQHPQYLLISNETLFQLHFWYLFFFMRGVFVKNMYKQDQCKHAPFSSSLPSSLLGW